MTSVSDAAPAPADAAASVAGRRLVLDALGYAQRVLLQGAPMPWEAAAHARLLGQVGALLRPDLTLLDLGALVEAAVAARPALREQLAGGRRRGAALRALLADEEVAAEAVEAARVVAATSVVPQAVQVPSPRVWLTATLRLAGRDDELDEDDCENASIYIADWLRRFAEVPIDAVLLDARGGDRPEDLGTYAPLRGLAEHYRWRLALRTETALEVVDGTGAVLDARHWLGERAEQPPAGADLVISEIFSGADPETVLAARAQWERNKRSHNDPA